MAAEVSAFSDFVRGRRQELFGCAVLVFGDALVAEQVVQASLARAFLRRRQTESGWHALLGDLLRQDPARIECPWVRRPRFELVDGPGTGPALAAPILADLARLEPLPRQALVLDRYLRLRHDEISAILDADPDRVRGWVAQARWTLTLLDHRWADEDRLTDALTSAVPAPPDSEVADDVAHGRLLRRRRSERRALGLLAVVILFVLVAVQLGRLGTDVSHESTTSTTTRSSSALPCEPSQARCQIELTERWRGRTMAIVRSYLDPDGAYFTGFSYRPQVPYSAPGLWNGRGGALGLDVIRMEGGATSVLVQIATDERHAWLCGQRTRQTCVSTRAMSGDLYSVTPSVGPGSGVEVQYSPDGRQVITVIAVDAPQGRRLPIDRSRLIDLVQDSRLRLPLT
ncbi:hypothetical protein GCM10009841_02870 [Microlunatus panaciterrae]